MCDHVRSGRPREWPRGASGVTRLGDTSESELLAWGVATVGTGELGVLTITKSLASHNLTIVCLTGSVKIVGAGFLVSTMSGLVAVGVGRRGVDLSNALTPQAVANLKTFLTDVQPTVFTYEMREPDNLMLPALLTTLFDAIADSSAPDIIGFGSPWDGRANMASFVADQNTLLKTAVEAHGGLYWDGNDIIPDWDTINALGWGEDPVHPAQGLSKFYVPLIMRDLGISGLYGAQSSSDVNAARVAVSRDVRFDGKLSGNPEGLFRSDPQFGYDVLYLGKRWLRFMDSTGAMEVARFCFDNSAGWLLGRFSVGKGMATLSGSNSSTLSVTKNGITKAGDISVRAIVTASGAPAFAASQAVVNAD